MPVYLFIRPERLTDEEFAVMKKHVMIGCETMAGVYDALRSKRVHKNASSHEKSLKIIVESAGTHFDPTLTEIFAASEGEFERLYSELP